MNIGYLRQINLFCNVFPDFVNFKIEKELVKRFQDVGIDDFGVLAVKMVFSFQFRISYRGIDDLTHTELVQLLIEFRVYFAVSKIVTYMQNLLFVGIFGRKHACGWDVAGVEGGT